jgi:hypothetical protein
MSENNKILELQSFLIVKCLENHGDIESLCMSAGILKHNFKRYVSGNNRRTMSLETFLRLLEVSGLKKLDIIKLVNYKNPV